MYKEITYSEKLTVISVEPTETYVWARLTDDSGKHNVRLDFKDLGKCEYAIDRKLYMEPVKTMSVSMWNVRESWLYPKWNIVEGESEPTLLVKAKNDKGEEKVYTYLKPGEHYKTYASSLVAKNLTANIKKMQVDRINNMRGEGSIVKIDEYYMIESFELDVIDVRLLKILKPNLNLAIDYICNCFSPQIPRQLEEGICLSLLAKNYTRNLKIDPLTHNAIYIYNSEKSTGKTATAMINMLGFNNIGDPLNGFFEINRLTLPNMTGWTRGETFIPPKDKDCLITLYDEVWAVKGDLAKQIQDLAAKHANDEYFTIDVGNPLYAEDKKLYKQSIQICTGNYLPYTSYVCKRYVPFKLKGARTVLDVEKQKAIQFVSEFIYASIINLHKYIPTVTVSSEVEGYLAESAKQLYAKVNVELEVESAGRERYKLYDVYNEAEVKKQIRVWAMGEARLNVRKEMTKEDVTEASRLLEYWYGNNGWLK